MHTRILILLIGASFLGATARAADDSFVGKWKLNQEKSQFNGLTYKIEDLGGDKYSFTFGDDVETMPADGKPHPTKFGNTWTITKVSANNWKFAQKRDGKLLSEENWTISDDGKTFTSTAETKRPDGSTSHDETKLTRTAGETGFAGTWESSEVKIGSPGITQVAKWQGDGYSISHPAYKENLSLKLDGKDYADKGPQVPKDMMVSGKRIDDHNLELTYKMKGKVIETDRWELAADGKTLTDTITYSGVSKPEVDVMDRQ